MKTDSIQVVTVDGSLDDMDCPLTNERLRAAVNGNSYFSSYEDQQLAVWALKIKAMIATAKA